MELKAFTLTSNDINHGPLMESHRADVACFAVGCFHRECSQSFDTFPEELTVLTKDR